MGSDGGFDGIRHHAKSNHRKQDMNDLATPSMAPEAITAQLIATLEDFTADWDSEFEGDMNRDTKLLADLSFESIDIIQLVVAIEEDFGKRKLPFETLLMKDGRYVDDLSIGQISDFLAQQL